MSFPCYGLDSCVSAPSWGEPMPSPQATQLVASSLVGLLIGLLAGGVIREPASVAFVGGRDSLLLGLLVLASFSLGVFLTWVFFSF